MKIGLGVKLGTSLTLTPQLQQAIRMLQLSNIELEQEVQKELNENPLLERDNSDTEPFENQALQQDFKEKNNADLVIEAPQGLDKDMSANTLKEELAVDTHWDDVYIHESTKWDISAPSDFDFQGETTDSLQSHLEWQMNLAKLSSVDQLICQRLIDSLDDNGFLGITLEDLHENMSLELAYAGIDYELELDEIAVVLKRLQQCEPVGVCARNLAESLQIQLKAFHEEHEYFQGAMNLLTHHELLVKNDLKNLMKTTRMTMEAIQSSISLIRELNPYPAKEFTDKEVTYNTPDVLVHKVDGRWQVKLNPDTLPRLRVNNSYADLFKKKTKTQPQQSNNELNAQKSTDNNAEANEFIKTKMQHAKQFIRSLDERHSSLLRVATAIVETQYAFFEEGATALKPLILKEIADQVELHESTVSRITTNKYMLTSNGMYELKYFFSSGLSTDSGTDTSSTAICAQIKTLIEAEDCKKPLSDSAITKLLQNKGIDVARRTVAKYRESLGYPSSTQRKRLL